MTEKQKSKIEVVDNSKKSLDDLMELTPEERLLLKNVRKQNMGADEMKAFARGLKRPNRAQLQTYDHTRPGYKFKFGLIGDTHMGNKSFNLEALTDFYNKAHSLGVREMYHAGDLVDGLHVHRGQEYELYALGMEQQAKDVIENYPKKRGMKTFYILGNHDCVSDDTEILTKTGWKGLGEIDETDFALSLEKGFSVWKKIDNLIVQHHATHELVSINTNDIDILCTRKHRVLNRKRNNDKTWSDLGYTDADRLRGRIAIPISGKSSNKDFDITDDELRICAWILTDGGIQTRGKHSSYTIYQSKPIDRIIGILDSLGYQYSISTRNREIKSILGKLLKSSLPQRSIYIKAKSTDRLKQLIPTKIPVPDFVWKLSDRQFDIFLSEIILGDGSSYKNSNNKILYGSKQFLDTIQALCAMHGYSANMHMTNRNDFRLNIGKKSFGTFDTCLSKSYKRYYGKVWCINVSNTNFLARRNGKQYFIGNCWYKQNAGADISKIIDAERKDMECLGDEEADIILPGKSRLRLLHPGDGSSYALSYKPQKLIESLSGGTKPNILGIGHYHKMIQMVYRNVHAFLTGTFEEQTPFMRKKSLQAHVGGWIIEGEAGKNGGIKYLTATFVPYMKG